MPRFITAATAIAVVAIASAAWAEPALAHERRSVGPYQLVVGFVTEPAFAGAMNGVSLRVTDTRVTPARNVEELQDTVAVDVFQGGLTTPLALKLRELHGQPGAYTADFVPTRAGSYRFVFTGKIEEQDLNETFESGPGRFDDAEDPASIQYPVKVPTGSDLVDQLDAIERDLGSIRTLAIVALVLAVVIPLASRALRRRARS